MKLKKASQTRGGDKSLVKSPQNTDKKYAPSKVLNNDEKNILRKKGCVGHNID